MAQSNSNNQLPTSLSTVSEDNARLKALVDSIGDGVIATDGAGRITHINQVALDILGYKRRDVLHKRFPSIVTAVYDNGKPLKIIDRPIAKAFMTGKSVSQQINYRRKDGRMVPVQLTVSPIVTSQRKPIGAVEVFRDVSIETQSERIKSDFISIASHQLRTPLSSINIYTHMLGDGMAGTLNDRQRTFIETILLSVDRMNELINTLLNVTRIEAGGLTITYETVDVVNLLQQILAEIMPGLENKKLSLTVDIPDEPIILTSDNLLLKEVFANLLTNAIKYTPPAGMVHISLSRNDTDALLSVSDSGIGIPQSAQAFIFSKFFRADNILQKEVSGTGLGLYLTKIIVEQLGGEVWFTSTEGVGSDFYVSLPLDSHADRHIIDGFGIEQA